MIEEHPDIVKELTDVLADYVKSGRSTEGEPQKNEPNNPTGDWEQLEWMEDYQEYVQQFKQNSTEETDETKNKGIYKRNEDNKNQ